jgi:hypothetical protein
VRWPFVLRSTYDQLSDERDRLRRERNLLLDTVRNYGEELRKHRRLIAELGEGESAALSIVTKKKAP